MIRLTKWGKANAEALNAVVGAVERHHSAATKKYVAATPMDENARDVLDDAVARHDAKIDNPSREMILVRELAKTIGLRLVAL